MVATLPFLEGHSKVCTHMSWGFNPNIATWSPFHGAAYAVTESVCRAVASGARLSDIRLTLQEYFPKLGDDASRWGLPFAALLGAFKAQHELRLGAIGGKDSMSGTFNDIDVPPTLVSFALAPGSTNHVISPEFKKPDLSFPSSRSRATRTNSPISPNSKKSPRHLHGAKILSAHTLDHGGLATGLSKMAFGNQIGATIDTDLDLYQERASSFLIESDEEIPGADRHRQTQAEAQFKIGEQILDLNELLEAWSEPLADIYPEVTDPSTSEAELFTSDVQCWTFNVERSKTKVLIPAFPGHQLRIRHRQSLSAKPEPKPTSKSSATSLRKLSRSLSNPSPITSGAPKSSCFPVASPPETNPPVPGNSSPPFCVVLALPMP